MINRILLIIFILVLAAMLGWCSRQQRIDDTGSAAASAANAAGETLAGATEKAAATTADVAGQAAATAGAAMNMAAQTAGAAADALSGTGEKAAAMVGSTTDSSDNEVVEPAPKPEDFAAAATEAEATSTAGATEEAGDKAEPSPPALTQQLEATLTAATEGTDASAIVLEGVNFLSNSDELTPEAAAVLDVVIADLASHSAVKVEIAGYTDNTGDPAYNVTLSQRRARAVVDYLVKGGIDASRLTARGYGAASPIADNATAEGRQRNRRVELHVLR